MKLYLPPTMRFIVELATWVYFVIIGYWYITLLFMVILSLVNFPGDKKPADVKMPGIYVSGWIRVSIEILFGLAGIYAAFLLDIPVLFWIQIIITLLSYLLDFQRWLWMFGRIDTAPEYVTIIHKTN